MALGLDFSALPISLPCGRTTRTAEPENEGEPVSRSAEAAPGLVPAASPVEAATASEPTVGQLTTRTVAKAPDGSADTRTTVGVNEQVEMSAPATAAWTASSGALDSAKGAAVVWTAPAVGGTSTITAKPKKGDAFSVTMKTIAPRRRFLRPVKWENFLSTLAGSQFTAQVFIEPRYVSFSRIEVREATANAKAKGYYAELGWDGKVHPVTEWLSPDATNNGLFDRIGTLWPGHMPPFKEGSFVWEIPQYYRIVGVGGDGDKYCDDVHSQVMYGPSGAEITSKAGASRLRTPEPSDYLGRPKPARRFGR